MNDKEIKKLLKMIDNMLGSNSGLSAKIDEIKYIDGKATSIARKANRQMDRHTIDAWKGKKGDAFEQTVSSLADYFEGKNDIVAYGKAIGALRRVKEKEIREALKGTPFKRLRFVFSKKRRKAYDETLDIMLTAITHFALVEIEKDIKERYEVTEVKNVKRSK